MNSSIGIIGGSGVYQLEALGAKEVTRHKVQTPYGAPSEAVVEFELAGKSYFFIPRHGFSHQYSPSEVNYCANIYALKSLGVKYVVSLSAVGSLKEEMAPGHFVFIDQFMDFTKGLRRKTFFGEGLVGHVSCAYPIEMSLSKMMFEIAKAELPNTSHMGGTYICIEGPQFSTLAESKFYRSLQASVIGMTNVPEAFLAKEAGLAYATLAAVTDYDCWHDKPCSVDEIMKVMKDNNKNIQQFLKVGLPKIAQNLPKFEAVNQFAVMTKEAALHSENKLIHKFILS
jgi:5'-methylthioadenosine phosphorylase